MAGRVAVVALLALCAGACATERQTLVVSAADACTRYGFTADSADYFRCREQVAISRQPTMADTDASPAELIAQSRVACEGYGVLRGTPEYDRCVQDEFAARRPG
jgi:hypothetical protein